MGRSCNAMCMSMNTLERLALDFDEAERIRKAMRASGVGVQDLARHLDVNRNTVGNWINGHIQPSVQSLYAIAAVTGVPFQWLKTGTPPLEWLGAWGGGVWGGGVLDPQFLGLVEGFFLVGAAGAQGGCGPTVFAAVVRRV